MGDLQKLKCKVDEALELATGCYAHFIRGLHLCLLDSRCQSRRGKGLAHVEVVGRHVEQTEPRIGRLRGDGGAKQSSKRTVSEPVPDQERPTAMAPPQPPQPDSGSKPKGANR